MGAISTTTAIALATAAAASAAGTAASVQQANAQAKISKQRANRERVLARQRERDFRKRQSAIASRVRAIGGARGIDLSTGSPLLSSTAFDKEVELQARRIREGGEVSATRLEQQAGLLEGAGTAKAVGGGLSTTANLFGGIARRSLILEEAG